LGIIDSVPALLPASNLPFRIDEDDVLLSRVIVEADSSRGVIGTAKTAVRTSRYLIIPVRAEADASTGLFVIAVDLDAELDGVAQSFATYMWVALISVVLIGLVAAVVSGRLLRPIRLLTEAATRSSTAAELTDRIPVR